MADSPSELQFEIETLERRHAENPEGRFFVPLANAYRKLGDVETAEALLRSGIERHPDYLSAHIVLGRCLADRGAAREAEEEFRFVLSQDPQNLIALRTLGELASADGRTGEAAQWYQELLAVDPMNEEARQALETLGGASSAEEVESEFRSGAGWWEGGGEEEATESWQEPPGAEAAPVPAAEDPTLYGDISLEEQSSDEPDNEEEVAEIAEPGGTEGETPATDVRWNGEQDEEALGPAGYGGSYSSEVVTETIAELYARQGLHERAASVYRELIRRRGGDPSLERRLAEIEGMARADLPEEEELPALTLEDDEALISPPLDEEEDAFAASFADGFTTVYDDEPSADAEEDESVAAPAWSAAGEAEPEDTAPPAASGVTIVDFLSGLARWRTAPRSETTLGEQEAAGAAEVAPESELWDGFPEDTSGAEVEDLPYLQEAGGTSPSAGTGSAEDEPFPWELPGGEDSQEVAPERREPEGSALDPYFMDDVEPASPAEEPVLPEAPPPQPQSRREAEPPPGNEPSEDEDLESFQAWLRSLKR